MQLKKRNGNLWSFTSRLNPHDWHGKFCFFLECINRQSVSSSVLCGEIHVELAQIRIWATPTVPTVGPETYLGGSSAGHFTQTASKTRTQPRDQQMATHVVLSHTPQHTNWCSLAHQKENSKLHPPDLRHIRPAHQETYITLDQSHSPGDRCIRNKWNYDPEGFGKRLQKVRQNEMTEKYVAEERAR